MSLNWDDLVIFKDKPKFNNEIGFRESGDISRRYLCSARNPLQAHMNAYSFELEMENFLQHNSGSWTDQILQGHKIREAALRIEQDFSGVIVDVRNFFTTLFGSKGKMTREDLKDARRRAVEVRDRIHRDFSEKYPNVYQRRNEIVEAIQNSDVVKSIKYLDERGETVNITPQQVAECFETLFNYYGGFNQPRDGVFEKKKGYQDADLKMEFARIVNAFIHPPRQDGSYQVRDALLSEGVMNFDFGRFVKRLQSLGINMDLK